MTLPDLSTRAELVLSDRIELPSLRCKRKALPLDEESINNKMRIQELFTQPYDWNWFSQSNEEAIAHFSTGKVDYSVNFTRNFYPDSEQTEWFVEFAASTPQGRSYSITKTGDAAQVFATVLDIIKQFKKSHPKQFLLFSAEEPSRQKLYLSLIKKLSSSYTVDTDHEYNTKYYKVL